MTPTPIHEWRVPGVPEGCQLFVKRDDLSGMQLSGNKVRKLEFLMAEAKTHGHDCVITIGGVQSNHCRATATAAKYVGLETHLILRNTERGAGEDPGLVGNLLVERMQGAHVHQVSKAEYVQHGSPALGFKLANQLRSEGKNPYLIPVGGSNSLGCWGYMMALEEIRQQTDGQEPYTHICMACGSGATTAGLALASHLSGYGAKVVGYGVCDSDDYFYDFIDDLFEGLGAEAKARDLVTMKNCKGAGYAISREEELQTALDVAQATGIIVDPVYSGKAVHALLRDMREDAEEWQGARVLFVHTGGLLGMYDKISQLQPLVEGLGRSERMQV